MSRLLSLILCLFLPLNLYAYENAFYILHSKSPTEIKAMRRQLEKLEREAKKISLLISQSYHIDEFGVLQGYLDDEVKAFSQKHHIPLLAMVTNQAFDPHKAHLFLSNKKAKETALNTLIKALQKEHLQGVQFDFEGIKLEDRNLLTAFFLEASKKLHQHKYLVSIAVIPKETNGPFASEMEKRRFENWSGAYDLKKLQGAMDFITIMAYDQHGQGTLPGPIAGFKWVQQVIKVALKEIPCDKISLGLPSYSGYWYLPTETHDRLAVRFRQVDYHETALLKTKYHFHWQWDTANQVHFAYFQHHWLNDYLFIEDSSSFKAKYKLMKRYHLRGMSLFRIGSEDQRIWLSI